MIRCNKRIRASGEVRPPAKPHSKASFTAKITTTNFWLFLLVRARLSGSGSLIRIAAVLMVTGMFFLSGLCPLQKLGLPCWLSHNHPSVINKQQLPKKNCSSSFLYSMVCSLYNASSYLHLNFFKHCCNAAYYHLGTKKCK